MSNNYANEPNQSRAENIIQSILDEASYDEKAQSRIEYLLIQLKTVIEQGGGGGITSYDGLTGHPKIDNHELVSGNNSSSDLGLQTTIDSNNKLSADLVDDTSTVHKFATSEQLSQIATNTSNISTLQTQMGDVNTALTNINTALGGVI